MKKKKKKEQKQKVILPLFTIIYILKQIYKFKYNFIYQIISV